MLMQKPRELTGQVWPATIEAEERDDSGLCSNCERKEEKDNERNKQADRNASS